MVPLEELAAAFRLRTVDAIARVQSLEAAGRLTGVMDERGKFIYVSREEMHRARGPAPPARGRRPAVALTPTDSYDGAGLGAGAQVAEYIRQNGRVTIAELAAKSSSFIDLAPTEASAVAAPGLADLGMSLAGEDEAE